MLSNILLFYGIFLLSCGIVSVAFIGMKAKTALLSGGTAGFISFLISYSAMQNMSFSKWAALALTGMLFAVFSWRATVTFFNVLELATCKNEQLKAKAIAFLIISLMAIVSLMVFAQIVLA